MEEIFFKNGRGPEIIMDPRKTRRAQIIGNLSTEDTEDTDGWELDGIILGSLRLEILEEIFFKNGRGPEIIMDPRRTQRARIIGNLSTEDTEGTDG